ncbi:MAG: T9SS type A sorting domain-containing protein, partial [Candidatus Cloacimonetes bacterium]|nr:T9SS type A sorting domain-containing protein [Candidatus Cloacimonadota bacterium]
YPNPFNPETKIEYYLDRNQKIEISIYNLRGQKIRKLENSVREAGYHSVIWDGSDNNGRKMPSGIYFTRISGLDFSDVHKMVMIK